MLKINHVKKSFHHNVVLSDVNLEVKKGELIHIKGINGSGKSTLLKIIAGFMKADQGTISIDKGVKIGALIENPSFIEGETIAFNLKFLYCLTNTYDEDHIRKLVEQFQLDFDAKTPIKKYSLGMRQKVGIIQAIMEDQSLLLFDEPTRGLDKKAMDVFNSMILDLIQAQKCIIICAHDGVDTLDFTQVYELEDGKLY